MHRERTATVDLALALPLFRGGVCLRTLAGDFLPAPLVTCDRQSETEVRIHSSGAGAPAAAAAFAPHCRVRPC